ncbi:MAG TPA: hypothetical protein VEL76_13515 [Gemmataceae bacterium]|nr:hypothetical protein [Gemmataceae bacterium]
MNDSPNHPNEPHPRSREYEDPHFHDEEPEIQQDEGGPRPNRPPGKRKPNRKPPPPRRHYED